MKYGTLVRIGNSDDAYEKFKKLSEIGIDSCQLVYKPENYVLSEAAKIRAAAEKCSIEISAFFAGFRDGFISWDLKYDYRNAGLGSAAFGAERLRYVVSALPFVKELGVTDVIVHAGFIPNDPFASAYADMLCRIKLLTAEAAALGLNILFETGGESPVTLLRTIVEIGADNLFINLDTGNLIMYGYGNPADAVMTFGKYVRNVHAKDGLPPTDPYRLGKEVPIGEGVVDFERVLRLLLDVGYDRFITIEREITGEEQTRDIKNGLQYLKNIIKKLKNKE